jgi:hypothetical protein
MPENQDLTETYTGYHEGFSYNPPNGKYWDAIRNTTTGKNPFLRVRERSIDILVTLAMPILPLIAMLTYNPKRQEKQPETKYTKLENTLPSVFTATEQDGIFSIGGVNRTEAIRSITHLTGLPISELERRMLPDMRDMNTIKKGDYYGSTDGFRLYSESLLDILSTDNDYVSRRGLTHQDVARPMLQLMYAFIKDGKGHRLAFDLNGKKFVAEMKGFPMWQDSPFNDGISVPGMNIYVENRQSHSRFGFALLNPILIARFGFYEGKIEYRVEPEKAIDFFY